MSTQNSQAIPKYNIQSGEQAIIDDVPDIVHIVEGVVRAQSKIAIIGKWKVAKSFFAIQMGMSIASGGDFLGFKTTALNVLYINFEISKEMLQQRLQDLHHKMPNCSLARFKSLTITDLSLDVSTEQLEAILDQCLSESFPVQLLIIDPRLKAITKDSNQDEVVRAFCVNLDRIISIYKLAVIIVHHEGVATNSDKAGKGSTVFEAWLDGWFKIKPLTGIADKIREIHIWSRDCEKQVISAKFEYPIHEVNQDVVNERKAKTQDAKDFIINMLGLAIMEEREVRFQVLGAGHTSYAFWRARKELVEAGRLMITQAPNQPGNRKLIQLVPHP
jgi:RecA-family ATPase